MQLPHLSRTLVLTATLLLATLALGRHHPGEPYTPRVLQAVGTRGEDAAPLDGTENLPPEPP